jgi:hypothetical protein
MLQKIAIYELLHKLNFGLVNIDYPKPQVLLIHFVEEY